ncbi:unnamed protein product [Cylindrotheca closterium]|uniref:Uncharacterized protein n=1 Tax=Cylindrotheca closterium TaxID=2856 RepID=A0AAD2CSP0_9STRA|nr:unnamed protein product [Cylindrotheca closterium]
MQSLTDSPNLSIIGSSTSSSNRISPTNNDSLNQPEGTGIQWNRLLISPQDLGRLDYFSDSWLMNRESFLQINVDTIETVEDACFQVIDDETVSMQHQEDAKDSNGRQQQQQQQHQTTRNKMFVDWTNFSVEHLSKWWKNLQALSHSNPGMADQVVRILKTYLHKVRYNTAKIKPANQQKVAIGMIAFQSYESPPSVGLERGHQLTAHSLAATIGSLLQVGMFGHIVVGGYKHPSDSDRVKEAFTILEGIFLDNDSGGNSHFKNPLSLAIGDTQVAYVQLEESWVQTKRVTANIPRGVLLGMQKALQNEFPPQEQAKWIGSSTARQWQYFYLTEPDSILNTKPKILPLLRSGLDQGWIFFPHRWQPIPHQADLPNHHDSFLSPSRYIPNTVAPFSNVTNIQSPWNDNNNSDHIETSDDVVLHCCDDGMDKPGRTEAFGTKMKPCGKWWWACGFSSLNQPGAALMPNEVLELHKRLIPYPMMRLQGGTSFIVAASEMGRRCLPSKRPCAV